MFQFSFPTSILTVLVFCSFFFSSVPVAIAGQTGELLIPWGNDEDGLKEAVFTEDARQQWKGPSSFRVTADNKLYVLNTLNASVEAYSRKGQHLARFQVPRYGDGDEESVCLDFALSPLGEVLVLEESTLKIYVFSKDQSLQKSIPLAGMFDSTVLLSSIECDNTGRIYVLNAWDNSVLILSSSGEKRSLVRGAPGNIGAVTPSGMYLVKEKLDSKGNPKGYEVVNTSLESGKSTSFAAFSFNGDLAGSSVIGVDSQGAVYVELLLGIVEKVTSRKVMVFDKTGTIKRMFSVSRPPVTVAMVRSRSITSLGQVACGGMTKKGFLVRFFE